ncbi:hypothetical protein IMSAGC002_02554 [Lachnospiraceae bacterium]|jgi:hypothetical protein|nr:hypothetical protein IMSAGC002_02554 [Lachnospiraceae bacterium]
MEQNENGREEIAQIIEEHIDFMTRRYRETGSVFKSIVAKIGFFPYMECLGKVLMDKDWDRLNNLIYQENCFRSLCSLMCGDTRYWAFLDMLDALAVGNMKTLELLVPHKTEPVTNIFPAYRPATNMLIGLWRKDSSVLDYAVPRAKKFVSGKRPQWERAAVAYLLAVYDKNPEEAGVQLELLCKGVMRADFDADTDKVLFVPAHGLYQLAACLWDKELFQQLPMPNHKIFSKEYAVWRNTHEIQPELFVKYPEPVINNILINPEIEMS